MVNRIVPLIRNVFFGQDPFFLILYVTSRCNARCKMCYNWKNIENWKERRELSLAEIEKITSHIKSLQQLTISGGEPFLRDDLAEICSLFARNCKVQFITIPTNGLLAERVEAILSKAVADNPRVHFRIGLSMSEIRERLDALYDVKGAFQRHQQTFAVLQALQEHLPNLSVDVGIVFSRFNQEAVRETVDYAVSNMSRSNPIVMAVRGRPRCPEASDIDVDALEAIYVYCEKSIPKVANRPMALLINVMTDIVNRTTIHSLRRRKMAIPCQCGRRMLVIYDNGDVFPCELLEDNMGNLREYDYDIHRILALPKSRETVDNIKKAKCFCTWECATNNNIVFSNKYRLITFWKALSHVLSLNNRYPR